MLKGLDIVELAQKIKDQAGAKKDFIAEGRQLAVVTEVKGTALAVQDRGQFTLNEVAHGQLAEHVEIPAKYYNRLRREDAGLLAANVNRWLRDDGSKRMVRVLGDTARGLVSNSYQRIDHDDVAKVALPVLLGDKGIEVVSSEITDKRLYIQAVNKSVEGEIKGTKALKVNDIVHAGVVVSNSEVGFGQASVTALIWRLYCLNGAKFNDSKFGVRHVGRKITSDEQLYSEQTKRLEDRTILSALADHVRAALSEVTFKQRIDKANQLAGVELKRPQAAVQLLANTLELSQGTQEDILDALIKGGDVSAWGLVNAVTAQAHAAKDYDTAVELEELGGKLWSEGNSFWRPIIDAEFTEVKTGK